MIALLNSVPDMIGIVGVVFTLIAYYYLNVGKFSPDNMSYLLLNLAGSGLILFSLFFSWNLSCAIIEAAWISISLIGIYRSVKAQKLAQE